MKNIEKKIKNIISDKLNIKIDKIKNSASFIEDLDADSLDKVEFIMALEEDFKIEILDKDAEKINTVQDAIDYITNISTK